MSLPRVAFHVHTRWSFDGNWSLEDVARAFKRRGYDVVMTAEHSQSLDDDSWQQYQVQCAQASRCGSVIIPGIEYRDSDNIVHVPVWGSNLPHFGDPTNIDDLLAMVSVRGGLAILAHPGRRAAYSQYNAAWRNLVAGVEVWNRKYDGWSPNADALRIAREWGVPKIVALDFHSRRQFFPLGLRIPATNHPTTADHLLGTLRRHEATAEFLRQPVEVWATGFRAQALRTMEKRRAAVAPLLRKRH